MTGIDTLVVAVYFQEMRIEVVAVSDVFLEEEF